MDIEQEQPHYLGFTLGDLMDSLDVSGRLFGEVVALRVATQRLLASLALQTGQFHEALRTEHAAALTDLSKVQIADSQPGRAEMIRMHAERVLDDMYTAMNLAAPPPS